MSFVYPAFLFALSAIAVPIIIHLFNFQKYRTLYFSNVKFLQNLKKQKDHKSKLKNLLILASRILAISFLVLAFSQPFIPNKNNLATSGPALVNIYIDNSFSMNSQLDGSRLIDDAKVAASSIVDQHNNEDLFRIVTNDFESKHIPLLNKKRVKSIIENVTVSASSRNISEIISRQININNNEKELLPISYLISDFQESTADFNSLKPDTSQIRYLVPIQANNIQNIFIDTCWFEQAVLQYNSPLSLHVIINNNTDEKLLKNSLQLFINDKLKAPSSFDIKANSKKELTITFTINKSEYVDKTSRFNGRLEIKDHPVTFDDILYFDFQLIEQVSVLNIENSTHLNSDNNFVSTLFSDDSTINFNTFDVNNIDYSRIGNFDAIILNHLKVISSGLSQSIKTFLNQGGTILIIPHSDIDIPSYNSFLSNIQLNSIVEIDSTAISVNKINREHLLYKNVFEEETYTTNNLNLPNIRRYYTFSNLTSNSDEYLLLLENGLPFLNYNNRNDGQVYILSVALNEEFSNFHKHAIFVPTLYNIVVSSKQSSPLYKVIGKNASTNLKRLEAGNNILHLKNNNYHFDIIPEQKLLSGKMSISDKGRIAKAGSYLITADGITLGSIAYNYNRKESLLNTLSMEEIIKTLITNKLDTYTLIETKQSTIKENIAEIRGDKQLWKICLTLALLFLGVEVVLLRYSK